MYRPCRITLLPGVLVLAVSASLVTPAVAQNYAFLSRMPVAYLTDADRALLSENLGKAMNELADGDSVTWTNPDTQSTGTISVRESHEDYGTRCRSFRMSLEAKGRSGAGDYRMCRADDGSWKFAPPRRPG